VPAVPLDKLEVEIDTALDEEEAALIVMVYVVLAVCEALSAAWTVILADPAVVGVPEITPLLSVSPAGSVPLVSDHV